MLRRMRTTIKIDDALLAEAKQMAVESDRTLSDVVEEALRERLARRQLVSGRQRISLPTSGGGGLMPGVDLASDASLLELMEGERP
jgi:hypothetical protein